MSAVPPVASRTVLVSASERLVRSREQMARWLAEDEQVRQRSGESAEAGWLKGLRKNPLASMVVDALLGWWARQPVRTNVHGAEVAASAAIAPLVRRHPVATLAAAAVTGALVVRARPWRWQLSQSLLAGIVAQLAGSLFARRPPGSP